ncbi:MAG: type II toxin-antitoxin system VapC family toxin [Fimbriimonadales bacterium]|nr:type II toxin-antitoxin system VapC family toxin [Fimbriimonadales bacterium]
MTIENLLLDTNVVVRALIQDDPEHQLVASAIENCLIVGVQVYICSQNLFEMWAILTRPIEANGYGLLPQDVSVYFQQIVETFPVIVETPALLEIWRDLCLRYSVQGKQVHDARIVAFAKSVGIQHILTLNTSDFERFQHEIGILHPNRLLDSSFPD